MSSLKNASTMCDCQKKRLLIPAEQGSQREVELGAHTTAGPVRHERDGHRVPVRMRRIKNYEIIAGVVRHGGVARSHPRLSPVTRSGTGTTTASVAVKRPSGPLQQDTPVLSFVEDPLRRVPLLHVQ